MRPKIGWPKEATEKQKRAIKRNWLIYRARGIRGLTLSLRHDPLLAGQRGFELDEIIEKLDSFVNKL